MPQTQQVVHDISIARLKGLNGLEKLSLDQAPLTAITGANGCGKSTLLHALACCYRPSPDVGSNNYKFPQFFLPTTDSKWEGSSFSIRHSYREGASQVDRREYVYGKAYDRWTPRYESRPIRYVDYIGIRTCVPSIEAEHATSYLELTSVLRDDALGNAIREAASQVLNRNYTSLTRRSYGTKRRYRGVQFGGIDYSSLSMGAGEQRVFEIIERVYTAPKYSLILIDEIDLLLHEDALQKLVLVLNDRATKQGLQIIFTTHRESVLARADLTVHHIFNADNRTLTMRSTHPDVWHRLTGQSIRSLEVFVEDDLAQTIVAKVASDLKLRKHVEIVPVGAAINMFTLAGGLALRGELLSQKAFVLDGDVFPTNPEKETQINRVLTGHGPVVEQKRTAVLSAMMQFNCPDNSWPEKAIHELLTSIPGEGGNEVVAVARDIDMPMERHRFLNDVISRLGDSRETGLHKVIEAASQSDGWKGYVEPIAKWLQSKQAELNL